MSKSIAVRDDLYNQAAEVAAKDHVSIEEFVSAAVANRLATREYIDLRAKLRRVSSLSPPNRFELRSTVQAEARTHLARVGYASALTKSCTWFCAECYS
jgi:hypothetical protein